MNEAEISFDTFTPLGQALGREWIDTNGLGGWASSTVVGANTRRYHGLLVASLKPPVERYVFWSRSEEEVECAGRRFDLSTNLYPGAIHPRGFELQRSFSLRPWPTATFQHEDATVRKCVLMEYGRNTTCTIYENLGDAPITLRVRPLLAFRDYHTLGHENGGVDFAFDAWDGCVAIQPYGGLPRLYFHHNAPAVERSALWYRSFEYAAERERGLDFSEDLFSLFVLRFELGPGEQARLGGTLHEGPLDVLEITNRERTRRTLPRLYGDERVNLLAQTAKSFVVERVPEGRTVLAGYHWFTDWGRDTMIALPGLTLLEGDPGAAREILLAFAQHVDGGMIPNRFPDRDTEPEYNTVDAALWFVHAVSLYFQRSGDAETLKETLFPAVRQVLQCYRQGTRYGIRADADGLITAGEAGVQLTWMDAKIGDYVVTPRHGKAVEINALWHHALHCGTELARALGLPDDYTELAEGVRQSFNEFFWNGATGSLYDVVGPEGADGSIRPNQILAISLRGDLLPPERAQAVFDTVTRHLLTPVGLRSLSPTDPRYRPLYNGDTWHRDTAYHQGTVWGWLIGPYIDALVHVRGRSDETRAEIVRLLEPLLAHLREAGLGSISEIFDGDPPHAPQGCVSQAWSVAEVLRVYHQYVETSSAGVEPAALAGDPVGA